MSEQVTQCEGVGCNAPAMLIISWYDARRTLRMVYHSCDKCADEENTYMHKKGAAK